MACIGATTTDLTETVTIEMYIAIPIELFFKDLFVIVVQYHMPNGFNASIQTYLKLKASPTKTLDPD